MSLHDIRKYRTLILEKSGVSEAELDDITARILAHVVLMPDEEIIHTLPEAEAIMTRIDPDDVVFIATALALRDAVIWSDDAHFRRQTAIKIINTKEALALFI